MATERYEISYLTAAGRPLVTEVAMLVTLDDSLTSSRVEQMCRMAQKTPSFDISKYSFSK